MVKLTMLFRHATNEASFEERYVANLMLMEKMPGIIRRQANIVLGSPAGKSPYARILELYFDSYEALDAALVSEAGRTAGADLMDFAGRNVEMIFSEVYEE